MIPARVAYGAFILGGIGGFLAAMNMTAGHWWWPALLVVLFVAQIGFVRANR